MSDYWDELEKMEEERDAQEYAEAQAYKNGWNDALDELVDAVCCHSAFTNMQKEAIRIYAEELKEQKNG